MLKTNKGFAFVVLCHATKLRMKYLLNCTFFTTCVHVMDHAYSINVVCLLRLVKGLVVRAACRQLACEPHAGSWLSQYIQPEMIMVVPCSTNALLMYY